MGWLGDALFGKKKSLSINKIKDYQDPTQSLVDEQIGIGRQLMDPRSAINLQQQQILRQRGAEAANLQGQALSATGAQMGMSPGQILMQQRMAQGKSMGQANEQFQQGLLGQFQSGLGLMGGMTQMQQGLDENMANAYVNQIAQHNQQRQAGISNTLGLMGMAFGGAGSIMQGIGALRNTGGSNTNDTGSDIRLKENIELIGKSFEGVNIYEFDYKDKSYGEGRYRGVMAQEVPNASHKGPDGYLRVNYNKIDVDFERID